MLAYYRREARRYRNERNWYFSSPEEATEAIAWVCKKLGITPVRILIRGLQPGVWGGHYRPGHILREIFFSEEPRGPYIVLYKDALDLRIIGHELGHHLDAEDRIVDGNWRRGDPPFGYRWHQNRHRTRMRLIVDLLGTRYKPRRKRGQAAGNPYRVLVKVKS